MCVCGGGGDVHQTGTWRVGVKGTLHAALKVPALSEAGPRWGGRCVCVGRGGGMSTKQEHGVLV